MPRPTPAHIAYGSLTVVLATLVLLLATGARSGAAVAGLATAGLVLGLGVAAALTRSSGHRTGAAAARTAAPATAPVPRARVAGPAQVPAREASLRR